MSHQHHTSRNLAITVILNGIITIAQFIGGIVSGSLALMSDALHNLSDVISVILAYMAHRIGLRPQTIQSTFGYKRAEILAAFFNAITLIVISVYLMIEAGKRFVNPKEVDWVWMLRLGYPVFFGKRSFRVDPSSEQRGKPEHQGSLSSLDRRCDDIICSYRWRYIYLDI